MSRVLFPRCLDCSRTGIVSSWETWDRTSKDPAVRGFPRNNVAGCSCSVHTPSPPGTRGGGRRRSLREAPEHEAHPALELALPADLAHARHKVTRAPFAAWCPVCVRAKARTMRAFVDRNLSIKLSTEYLWPRWTIASVGHRRTTPASSRLRVLFRPRSWSPLRNGGTEQECNR